MYGSELYFTQLVHVANKKHEMQKCFRMQNYSATTYLANTAFEASGTKIIWSFKERIWMV